MNIKELAFQRIIKEGSIAFKEFKKWLISDILKCSKILFCLSVIDSTENIRNHPAAKAVHTLPSIRYE
jgi:hypothetical protein